MHDVVRSTLEAAIADIDRRIAQINTPLLEERLAQACAEVEALKAEKARLVEALPVEEL